MATANLYDVLGVPRDASAEQIEDVYEILPDPETFREQYVNDERGEGYIYEVLTFTLYSVPGGNVRPQGIADDAFLAE
ncbi:hypothetical protein [Aurantiacibacter gilvus]|uniref:J domain-containing protein n=1 Tax=Aurantiacibacter gilvus TaxID=3139141 RepID=A0ABU9IEP5_9SPHN